MDDGGCIDTVYLDFAKAFDSVPHMILLHKLEGYGIVGNTLRWISSFLSGRRQKVVVNGEASAWSSVISGVPQGSVLGPILFIYYINDMPGVVHGFIQMFADDTKIFTSIINEESRIRFQKDIDNLQSWSVKWQLRSMLRNVK